MAGTGAFSPSDHNGRYEAIREPDRDAMRFHWIADLETGQVETGQVETGQVRTLLVAFPAGGSGSTTLRELSCTVPRDC